MTNNISKERKKYLNDKKKKRLKILVTQIIILILFIFLWEFLVEMEIIDDFITSRPSRILSTFSNLSSNLGRPYRYSDVLLLPHFTHLTPIISTPFQP